LPRNNVYLKNKEVLPKDDGLNKKSKGFAKM
jgi:hypothetical protein